MSEIEHMTVSALTEQNFGESYPTNSEAHEFNIKTWYTDLTLVVEEDTLYVSKHVLAIVSPVFEAMFRGDYKEKYTNELALPGKKNADVLEFLRCIYPNIRKPVTVSNVYTILPLAEEYQVAMLKAACESCLLKYLSKDISADKLYETLTKAQFFNMLRVTERAMALAADRPHTEIDNADSKITLSEDIKKQIRVRMLQNLSTKCKNMSRQIDTSKALCTFLGAGAKQKNLVSKYIMEGRVVGDWKSFRVSSQCDDTVDLNVDGNLFTAHVITRECHYKTLLKVLIQCRYRKQYCLNCVGAVVVRNWMKKKDDIIKFGDHQFDTLKTEWVLWECDPRTIEDETAGFTYKGTINIDVFLFKRD